jgi:NAD(P)-dependent dehydrogenase (short-subunit alcohol dehydrogenase family)
MTQKLETKEEGFNMTQDLNGKVAIVTGASSGIGLETTKQFLAAGTKVVGAARSTANLAELAGPDMICAIDVDLTQAGAAEKVVQAAIDSFGKVDILFNNAGAAPGRDDFLSVTDEMWQQTFDLTVMGYIRMARAVIPVMEKQGKGVLIHCGSEAGIKPHPLLPDYSVSKSAINMISKILSRDYTRKGIRSNIVAPAHIRTELWDEPGGFLDTLADHYGVPRNDRDGAVAAFLEDSQLPAGRLGTPEDVARAVLYLASDVSDFVSGIVLGVDGGVVPSLQT